MKTDFELWIKPHNINFAPLTLQEEVLQNVLTLCSTPRFSVPLDRALGINATFLDQPVNKARALYTHEVIRAVHKFEPRAHISRVEFKGDLDGHVYPKLWVKILDA